MYFVNPEEAHFEGRLRYYIRCGDVHYYIQSLIYSTASDLVEVKYIVKVEKSCSSDKPSLTWFHISDGDRR